MLTTERAQEIIQEEGATLDLTCDDKGHWTIEDRWTYSDARLDSEKNFRAQVIALRDNTDMPLWVRVR